MDMINDLYDLCETLGDEIREANQKIKTAGGKVSAGDVDYIDKLTHALKSIKTSVAMMESENNMSGRNSYDGSAYNGSYRGRNNSGYYSRYSRNGSYSRGNTGYSGGGGLSEELQSLADEAPNERIKSEIRRLAEKVENMQ